MNIIIKKLFYFIYLFISFKFLSVLITNIIVIIVRKRDAVMARSHASGQIQRTANEIKRWMSKTSNIRLIIHEKVNLDSYKHTIKLNDAS